MSYYISNTMSICSDPFLLIFDVSGAQEMLNPNATDDDVFLALAKHVPALSSPVGGNAVLEDGDKNIDMNDGIPRPNGWGRGHPVFEDL